MACQLGCARNVVLLAYEQLILEGYMRARPKASSRHAPRGLVTESRNEAHRRPGGGLILGYGLVDERAIDAGVHVIARANHPSSLTRVRMAPSNGHILDLLPDPAFALYRST
jgi:DNA-binding transcriptional MocR family regulator